MLSGRRIWREREEGEKGREEGGGDATVCVASKAPTSAQSTLGSARGRTDGGRTEREQGHRRDLGELGNFKLPSAFIESLERLGATNSAFSVQPKMTFGAGWPYLPHPSCSELTSVDITSGHCAYMCT